MAAMVELRRGRTDTARTGDANQRRPRLALDLAKLPRCSSTAERRWRGGFKAATTLGFAGVDAQGLGGG
jgi:hypothetical protein